MTVQTTFPEAPGPLPSTHRIEQLLRRYPAISAEESAEIVAFLRKGPVLDVGILGGKEDLKGPLAAFQAEHRKALGFNLRDLSIVAGLLLATLLICFLLWSPAR